MNKVNVIQIFIRSGRVSGTLRIFQGVILSTIYPVFLFFSYTISSQIDGQDSIPFLSACFFGKAVV